MASNGKALVAAAIAGLMVVGVAYWWNRRDDNPRPGCATVVVTASVEKADLMGEVAKRYNASDRHVNGSCYGITVSAMASGLAESRLAESGWDQAWGPAPDAWSPRRPPGCGCFAGPVVVMAADILRASRVGGRHADRPRDT
jgi:Ca-activated chloride channel family protein